MADWIKSHRWHIVGAALLALLALGIYARAWQTQCEISSLRTAYARSVEQVKALETETVRLRAELDRKREEIFELRQENDRRIKEVTAGAYRKARNLSDAELLDAYNRLITGARQRNAERERRDSGDKE